MNRMLPLVCIVVIIFAASLYVLQSSKMKSESSDYRFEIVEGRKISVNNGVYVFGFVENCTERGAPYIKMINDWNLTLDEDLWISNVLKCLDGTIYAAGVDIAKIEDGRIEWIKDFVTKKVSYEGTRENLEGENL